MSSGPVGTRKSPTACSYKIHLPLKWVCAQHEIMHTHSVLFESLQTSSKNVQGGFLTELLQRTKSHKTSSHWRETTADKHTRRSRHVFTAGSKEFINSGKGMKEKNPNVRMEWGAGPVLAWGSGLAELFDQEWLCSEKRREIKGGKISPVFFEAVWQSLIWIQGSDKDLNEKKTDPQNSRSKSTHKNCAKTRMCDVGEKP